MHAQREIFLMRDSFGPWELGLVTPQGVLIICANSTHNKYIEHGLSLYMDSITLNPKESNKCRVFITCNSWDHTQRRVISGCEISCNMAILIVNLACNRDNWDCENMFIGAGRRRPWLGSKIRIGRKIHGWKSKGPLTTTATAMTTPASPTTTMFMRIRRERLRIRKKKKKEDWFGWEAIKDGRWVSTSLLVNPESKYSNWVSWVRSIVHSSWIRGHGFWWKATVKSES